MANIDLERRAFELFAALCDVPAEKRAEILCDKCGDDQELRKMVEKMLGADVGGEAVGNDALVDGFLQDNVRELLPEPAIAPLTPPEASRGGQYRIIRVIGEGGMGTVYEAEQINPRRRVAIKAIRSGLRSPMMRRRFEYEAQVLARLEHDGIARLYEADTRSGDESVLAYLAMEFVDGLPIDEYADANKLDIRQRLQLFLRLCVPIEYAHRVGVIHRDIKPANIFVQPDGKVKVLDFGVARSLNDHSQSMATLTGHFVGTLAYMSPEQIESSGNLDTRSDVYSLGVLLYKLLADRLPIDVRNDGLLTGSQRVREEKPPLLGSVNKLLRGDLEMIVAKALEKDRDRRYASVADFAADLHRFLDGRAITARGDSNWYLIRKAAWRYRAVVGVVSGFIALLTFFAGYATLQSRSSSALAIVAQTAQREAVQREDQTRRLLYFSSIGFAQSALENNDMERVHALLENCEKTLRDWEWFYLTRLCDLSSKTQRLKLDRPRYASFTKDRSIGAFASLGREILVMDQLAQREKMRITVDDGNARTALSPDGKWLAYGGLVQDVRLINLQTGEEKRLPIAAPSTTDPSLHAIRVIGFTDDSMTLVTGGLDQMLRVWDLPDVTLRNTIDLGTPLPICMLLPRGGHAAIIGDNRGGVRMFSLESGQFQREFPGHDAAVWSLAMSNDDKWLATGDNDARVIVWDLETNHIVSQQDTNDGWFTSLCFNPSGDVLALGRADATIRLLHLPEAQSIGVLRGHRHAIVNMEWRTDGLSSVSLDGSIKEWVTQSALQVPTIEAGQTQTVGLALAPDNRSIISGGSDGSVKRFSLDGLSDRFETKLTATLPSHDAVVLEVAVDNVNGRVCTGGRDGKLHITDLTTGALVRTIEIPGAGPTPGIDFSPDGKTLLVGSTTGITLWDPAEGTLLRQFECGAIANEVRFDLTGKHFYAACTDGHLRRWPIGSSVADVDLPVDPTGLYDVKLSPDGSKLAVSGDTASVVLIDTSTHTEIRRYIGHRGPVFGVAFHPNGARLASCGSDRSIRIWDVQTATELVSLRGHRRLVQHVEFAQDGKTLASSSDDGTIRLWRADTR
jgi:WD40 repeat protein/tRNA A-37 threonylcarbamoyl transferase component Bud32